MSPEASSPQVTVLIGAHDNARTIERAVRSILAQTFSDLEVIVLDDDSHDATVDVVQRIDDARLRCVPLPRQGIATTLNHGLRLARGEIVSIQDADDWSDPQRLARQITVLDEQPHVAVVGVRMREVSPTGRVWQQRTGHATGDVESALMRFNPLPNGASAFRRAVVLTIGGYDPRYRYASDYDLWLRIAEQHRIVIVDEVLATRELSGSNASSLYERRQILESLVIRARALRRSPRTWRRGAIRALMRNSVAWAIPLPIKRFRRRRLGQAP